MKLLLLLFVVGCHGEDWMQFRWDERRIVCSQAMDDIIGRVSWDEIDDQLALARDHDAVTFIHTHAPGQTVSRDALVRLFDKVEANGLDYVTFPELVPSPDAMRGGLALSFDDAHIDLWHELRDLFRERGVRASFFITRIHEFDDTQIVKLRDLYADGHAIEAHAVHHVDAKQYVCEHSARRYIDFEAIPSITRLRDLGFPVSSYAYPYGNDARDVNGALHREVHMLRLGLGACPY